MTINIVVQMIISCGDVPITFVPRMKRRSRSGSLAKSERLEISRDPSRLANGMMLSGYACKILYVGKKFVCDHPDSTLLYPSS